MKKIIIYTDGGARNNPGPAGIGVVLYDENKEIIETYKEYIGEATNNQAEYRALLKGLELGEKHAPKEVECFLDSELVVKQLNKEYKVKDQSLQFLYNQILDLSIFAHVSFKHVRREQNTLADKLVNEALDEA